MTTAYLGLGANIGSPTAQLEEAVARLEAHPQISVTRRSSIISTKPWGKMDQPDFRNMVVEIDTSLKPQALLEVCLAIELLMGRVRREVWGPRLIDIDIVAYDRLELDEPNLTIPHAHAHERDFVLRPLRELAPEVADWIVARQG